MKILMTADTVGGVWTYSVELARALSQYGARIALATMGAIPTAEQLLEIKDIPNIELHASRYKLEWMDEPWQDVQYAGGWLLQLEKRIKPDLIHLNGYVHGALPWSAPVLVVGHSCVLSWWSAVKDEPAPKRWDEYSHQVSRGLHAAKAVASPTKAMLVALERHYGSFNNARVVPNGRESSLFPSGDKEPFIFTAGRVWDEAKNIATLAEASPGLEWPVYVAGEDEHPEGTSHRHINIKLLGHLAPQALPYWYAKASIYALPARYEPFGLSALEAGLAGCALVLGDIPSLREVWGDAALFVPPNDTEALHSALQSLIKDANLRSELGARARSRAIQYTPERMAEGYLAIYNDLTRRHAVATAKPSEDSGYNYFTEGKPCA